MKANRRLYTFVLLLAALLLCHTAGARANSYYTGNGAWFPAGSGLPGPAMVSTTANGYLYVVHQARNDQERPNREYQISRWNGSVWQMMTSFRMESDPSQQPILGFEYLNGTFYLAGRFGSINNDWRLGFLAKWDGTSWSAARGNLRENEFAVSALTIHNGELHAAMWMGWDVRVYKYRCAVARWDGSDWRIVGLEISPWERGQILTLQSWNGDLYAGGYRLGEGDQSSDKCMMRWDGNTWQACDRGLENRRELLITNLVVFRNQLYASGTGLRRDRSSASGLARWNGTSWEPDLPVPEFISYGTTPFTVHNDRLYMLSRYNSHSGTVGVNYERIGRFDGTAWEEVSNTNGLHGFLASYNGSLILGGNFTEAGGASLANAAKFCGEGECGRITGAVFIDANGNCVRDPGEQGLARRFVEFAPGGQYAITDDEGNYSRYLDNGSYSISLRERRGWSVVCPASGGAHQATLSGTATISERNFAMQATAAVEDLRVTTVSSRARVGRQLTYAITYENAGTTPASGSVWFLHDPVLTFDSAQAAPSRYTPSVAEWKFKNLGIDERRTILVWTSVPLTLAQGTEICGRVWIEGPQSMFSADTRDNICVPVTGGYDPNDIRVTSSGRDGNGIITEQDSVLTYWVRFQNTGNDTAFKVVVVDTLSSHLDISSIKLGAASHPFSFSIDKSNVLVWTFNDIMLPDSNANEPNSHGFFKFSVKLKGLPPPGTAIANQAHIYFDYNVPVATNIVVSTLDTPMGVVPPAGSSLALYPNPVRDRIRIAGELRPGTSVTLRTMLGETAGSYRYDGGGMMTIDVRDLPAGTYLLTAQTADGIISRSVTVVK